MHGRANGPNGFMCLLAPPYSPLSSCLQHFPTPPHFLLFLPQFSFFPPKGLLPLPFFACVQCGGGRGALGCHSGTRSACAAAAAAAAAAVGGRGKSAADGCVFFSSSFFLTLYAVPRALRGKRRVDYKAGRRRRRRQERKKVGSTVHYLLHSHASPSAHPRRAKKRLPK